MNHLFSYRIFSVANFGMHISKSRMYIPKFGMHFSKFASIVRPPLRTTRRVLTGHSLLAMKCA